MTYGKLYSYVVIKRWNPMLETQEKCKYEREREIEKKKLILPSR